jgi:hypothetical protein
MSIAEQKTKYSGGHEINGPLIAGVIEDESEISLLGIAHNTDTSSGERAQIAALRIEMDALQDEVAQLSKQIADNREQSRRKAAIRSARVVANLRNPNSSYHPIYRAVLLSATEAGGSLARAQTFNQAHRLGESLVGFNYYLESSDERQPLVVVSKMPTPENPSPNLQLDYGYTIPGAPLSIYQKGEAEVSHGNLSSDVVPQLWASIPTEQEPPVHALMQSAHNSHFVGDDRRVIRVGEDGSMLDDTLSAEDQVPYASSIELPLPAGNLYDNKQPSPFILHDNLSGGVEAIELPGNYQGLPRDRFLIVGSRAIRTVFDTLPGHVKGILGDEKGRVAEAMVKTVARQKLRLPD